MFFETNGERLLVDPILRTTPLLGELIHQYPRTFELDRMPRPTFIVVTHSHFDHFDHETLAMLPHNVPILIPPDSKMRRKLSNMGFSDIISLKPWESFQRADFRIIATPSDAPVTELGLLVQTNKGQFWHMSDAEPPPNTSTQILSEYGPVAVVSTKFQPADPQLNFQHNMGSSFDRRAVADWLETACKCGPTLAFPYASGLCFSKKKDRLNRYAYPYSAELVADLLGKRLAGIGKAAILRPGDVISIHNGRAGIQQQTSPFVRQLEPEHRVDWEPFVDECLLEPTHDRPPRSAEAEFERILLQGEFASWLHKNSIGETALLKPFCEWSVLYQIVIHFEGGKRVYFHVDFTRVPQEPRSGRASLATYFTHIGADALWRLLAGLVTPLELMIEGSVFIHERIIALRNGHLEAPSTTRLYDHFFDPLLFFGGKRGRTSSQLPLKSQTAHTKSD